jgi:ClpX C4-type zinc finger
MEAAVEFYELSLRPLDEFLRELATSRRAGKVGVGEARLRERFSSWEPTTSSAQSRSRSHCAAVSTPTPGLAGAQQASSTLTREALTDSPDKRRSWSHKPNAERTVDRRSRLASDSMADKDSEPGQESERSGAPVERDALRCSFCGKAYAEVGTIVCGPTPSVAICNECVELCTEIIAQERGPTQAA